MILKDKSILIMGMGVTGLASAEELYKRVKNIGILDEDSEKLEKWKKKFKKAKIESNFEAFDLKEYDLLLKSPGIKASHPFILKAESKIDIVTDIELAYRLFPDRKIIAITGTNGKTTTTALVYDILKKEFNAHCLGNIGAGVLPAFFNGNDKDIYIIEISSFQLTHTNTLKADIAALINISPDHLDWHGNMDSYTKAKLNLFLQQDENDLAILNLSEKSIIPYEQDFKARKIYFSLNKKADYYLEGDNFIKNQEFFFDGSKLLMPGLHNKENALLATAIASEAGASDKAIINSLENFKGVEHRLEYIKEIKGIKFYNDSKATNPESTVVAINALDGPINLIAGGLDKKISYQPVIDAFKNKVKGIYLYGETKKLIKETANSSGFKNTFVYKDLEEATKAAFSKSLSGEDILFSPASASWDMYPNFEIRGDDFKKIVKKIECEQNE